MTAIDNKLKLDLGCGRNRQEGFHGVDVSPDSDADSIVNLFEFPWPWEDSSVDEVFSSHFVEHLPVACHGCGQPDGLISFMEEVHRICKPGAAVKIIHPYALSTRAFQDPTHTRFIPETTWHYFSAQGRADMKLEHYPISCDFELLGISNGFYPEWQLRAEVARTWAAQHYWNVVSDLIVDLRVVKEN